MMMSLPLVFLLAFRILPVQQDGAQLYRENCASCHALDGNGVQGVDFRSGQFRRAATDDELVRLIASGIPGTAMPPSSLAEMPRRTLVAFIRAMHDASPASTTGSAAQRGRLIFEGKGGCTSCHRVSGKGSRVGPDLSDVGATRRAPDLERSIVDPNATVLPQNRFVRAVTKAGATVSGRRLNEDSETVQLIDDRERLVSLNRSDLREYTLLKTSPMPSFQDKLTAQERADLVTYLQSLKGTNPQ